MSLQGYKIGKIINKIGKNQMFLQLVFYTNGIGKTFHKCAAIKQNTAFQKPPILQNNMTIYFVERKIKPMFIRKVKNK